MREVDFGIRNGGKNENEPLVEDMIDNENETIGVSEEPGVRLDDKDRNIGDEIDDIPGPVR